MGSLDIGNVFKVWKYNKEFRKQHPEYFDPEGIIVFCGMQGAGKQSVLSSMSRNFVNCILR